MLHDLHAHLPTEDQLNAWVKKHAINEEGVKMAEEFQAFYQCALFDRLRDPQARPGEWDVSFAHNFRREQVENFKRYKRHQRLENLRLWAVVKILTDHFLGSPHSSNKN